MDGMIRAAAAIAASLTAVAAAAQEALRASPIPADAKVIYASARAQEKDPFGLTADALYVASLNGKVTRITRSRFAHNHFSVAPNRRYIAANRYSRGDANKDGRYFPYDDWKELWLIDTVTGEERRIAPEYDAGWGGVAWAPDSQWVYFSAPTAPNVMDVRRVNIETDEVQLLTTKLNQLLGHGPDAKNKSVTDVDVSRDGQWLVFNYRSPEMMVDGMRGGKPKARIGVMRIDGTAAHLVSDGGSLPPGRRGVWPVGDFDPAISPDGRRVIFARVTDVGWITPDLSTWDLWIVGVDGTSARNFSGPGNRTAQVIPSWGDDDWIAFTQATMEDSRRVPYAANLRTGQRIRVDEEGRHAQMIPAGTR
jgi:Tol biopolymer transport system component